MLLRPQPLVATTERGTIAVQTALMTIFALLKATTGVDFSQYKPKTIDRRIQRRMLLCKLVGVASPLENLLADYVAYLEVHPTEVKALYEEILIHVTSFFRDPPFSNVDLISCRNVMIYLGDALQQRIMPIFHYSLNPTGFLLLGTSESTGKHVDMFTVIDKKYRIYAKNSTTTRSILSFAPSSYSRVKANENFPQRQSLPAVPDFDLQVIPFKMPDVDESHFLVLFEDVPIESRASLQPILQRRDFANDLTVPQGDLEREIAQLRQELTTAIEERRATQEYLRAVIQEQEYTNQDLKVANEEILSSNEELQSTNEELETAKEEIQVTNEELHTT